MERLSWKEKYSASLLLLAGVLYLAIFIISLGDTSALVQKQGDKISLSTQEVLDNIRSVITIICAIGGGLFILRKKTIGWILGVPVLLLIIAILVAGLLTAIDFGETEFTIAAACGILVFFLAFLFLVLPGATRRLAVKRKSVGLMLVTLAVIALLYLRDQKF